MDRSKPRMGGGGGYHYPQHVWSPAGGWWPSPAAWKRNTGMAVAAMGLFFVYNFSVSRTLERRPMPPVCKIPSQSWCTHAEIDDPSLKKK
mmetsp:Transcript_7801/g.9756  ORF Transcript_7801/g.9756 Transcript_7801/m.9756 type:complete len:90 (-) Transcript_7801:308-577(-)